MSDELEVGPNGEVILHPVVGWTTAPIAESAVLLRLLYVSAPDEFASGGRALQTVMTPQQALELAATLTKQANHILSLRPAGRPN